MQAKPSFGMTKANELCYEKMCLFVVVIPKEGLADGALPIFWV